MTNIDIRRDVSLAEYTTFGIGGPARYMIDVSSEAQLREALNFARVEGHKFFILAGGSNVLFSDDGFDGVVIRITGGQMRFYKDTLIADAGVQLSEAIYAAAERGLSGAESMYGIPGTVGGAVRGNAGAFGTEIGDVLYKVRAMDMQTGEVRDFNTRECRFSYRTSYFKTHPQWVVLTAVFKLTKASPLSAPSAKCDEVVAEREKRHLQDVRAAGSFFKNPVCTEYPDVIRQFEHDKGVQVRGDKVPAGWLIEQCSLKGECVGDALCSPQHPNYLVNDGSATARDVLELRDRIKGAVLDTFGITLEEEVTIVV